MAILQWGTIGKRVYENGLDQGVLYLNDGTAVPWDGLRSIVEKFDKSSSPVYFDGTKISDSVSIGDYSATLSAITYPDEFIALEGMAQISSGVFVSDQRSTTFAISYRTSIGNDVDGESAGYKTHILYNATAMPSDKSFNTNSENQEFTEFEWDITAVPENIPGFRPTAHVVFDSRKVDPNLLIELELILYGGPGVNPGLISLSAMLDLVSTYFRLEVVDNLDGTWTATTRFDGYITMVSDTEFEINATGVYLDDDTYTITNTFF